MCVSCRSPLHRTRREAAFYSVLPAASVGQREREVIRCRRWTSPGVERDSIVVSYHHTSHYNTAWLQSLRRVSIRFCFFCAFVSFFPVNAAATDDSGGDGDDDRHICVCLVLLFFLFFLSVLYHARSRGNRPDVSAFRRSLRFLTYLRIPNSSR